MTAVPVVLVHGVGFGPSTFAAVARTLRRSGPAWVLARRGYGARAHLAPAPRVEDHVDDLVASLDATGTSRAVVAGTSGGATVALAAALLRPDRVIAAVAHEPAVGSLAPELRQVVARSLEQEGATGLLRRLAGPTTWSRLSVGAHESLARRADLVQADARAFLAWEPPLEDRVAPVVASVGARSAALRHLIADRLHERMGARVVEVPGSGHLAQLDAPLGFADVVRGAMVPAEAGR